MITHNELTKIGFKQCKLSHNRYEKIEFCTKYVAILQGVTITCLKALKHNYLTGKTITISYPVFASNIKDFILYFEEISGTHIPYFETKQRKNKLRIVLYGLILATLIFTLILISKI